MELPVNKLFQQAIKAHQEGKLEEAEQLYRSILKTDPKNLNAIKNIFTVDYKPYVIGKIISGKNKVKLNGKIDWS